MCLGIINLAFRNPDQNAILIYLCFVMINFFFSWNAKGLQQQGTGARCRESLAWEKKIIALWNKTSPR